MLSKQFSQLESWNFLKSDVEGILDSIDMQLQTMGSATILPESEKIFHAFEKTKFDDVSLVILGQDPYHQLKSNGEAVIPQAMGLSFSVPKGIKAPPSLKNIFKVIKSGYPEFEIPDHGDLSAWTERGVLLLNTALTVEESKAGAHSKIGWSKFTKVIIEALSQRQKPVVFLSWGKHAHKITQELEQTHHIVIKTSHPSPLGALKDGEDFVAFMRSNCFKVANDALEENGLKPVDFSI